ncbi:MAG: hypothetical protein EOM20_19235 [Spartobacteria bacterium]|nr:hypothetical protein [Spartobacteria bacterium]
MIKQYRGILEWAGRRFVRTALLLAVAAHALCAWSAENYRVVEAEKLLSNPKHYWSMGVIFQDTLTSLPDKNQRPLKISGKYYTPFETKIIGICYADEEVMNDLSGALLNRNYLFKGTVLNRRSEFFVIVNGITPAVEGLGNLDENLFTKPGKLAREETILDLLMADINEKLYAYAEEQGVDMDTLLQRDSTHYRNVLNIIQSNIMTTEREKKTTASAILGDLIYDLFIEHYIAPVDETADTGEADLTPEQEAAVEAEKQAAKNAALRKKAASIMLKPGLFREVAPTDTDSKPADTTPKPKPMLMEGVPGRQAN